MLVRRKRRNLTSRQNSRVFLLLPFFTFFFPSCSQLNQQPSCLPPSSPSQVPRRSEHLDVRHFAHRQPSLPPLVAANNSAPIHSTNRESIKFVHGTAAQDAILARPQHPTNLQRPRAKTKRVGRAFQVRTARHSLALITLVINVPTEHSNVE